jgi:hypothetical protein
MGELTAAAGSGGLRRAGPRNWWPFVTSRTLFDWWIVGLFAFGIAGRVYFYTSPFGVFDGDEAVGGLMARDALHGHLTTFMWGQAYGGPLETWLAAPVVGLVGPGWLGLRIVPIALTVVASVLVWRVGLRTIGAKGAITASALSWIFPTTLLWKTTHFHIFYASSMVLGLLAILQALRMYEHPSRRGMFLLGLIAGVGLWQSFQLATILPTVILWLVIRRRDVVRFLPAAALGGVIGFGPVIGSNIGHGFWSHDIGRPGDTVPYGERLWRFFTTVLPESFDLRMPVTLHWFLWKPVGVALYLVVLGGFAWLVWTQRSGARRRGAEILIAVTAVFPFIYAISPLTTAVYHAGYVVVLMPVLSLLLVSWVRTEEQAVITSAIAVVLMLSSTIGLSTAYDRSRTMYQFGSFGDHAPLPGDFGPLITQLDRMGIRRVYASYWIAYRLTYESGGRIVAAQIRPEALRVTPGGVVVPKPNDLDLISRRPQFNAVVRRVAAPAFVIAKDYDASGTDYGALADAGYKPVQVGAFTIYHDGAPSKGTGSRLSR